MLCPVEGVVVLRIFVILQIYLNRFGMEYIVYMVGYFQGLGFFNKTGDHLAEGIEQGYPYGKTDEKHYMPESRGLVGCCHGEDYRVHNQLHDIER